MRRIEIISQGVDLPKGKVEYWADEGIVVSSLPSSWLSAFTSVSIAREVDRQSADQVLVTRVKDAIAAVSARRLAKTHFEIICEVAPNSQAPRGIPHDVRSGVDAWWFPSQRLREKFPADLKEARIAEPICYDARLRTLPLPHPAERKQVLWLGPIDSNVAHLKSVISDIGNGAGDAQLRILGSGKARYVMQAVRASRGVQHPERIVWLGDDADLYDEAQRASHVAQSGPDPSAEELALQSTGRILIPHP